MKADEIVEMILKAARESKVFSGRVYTDEPIVRTGRQAYGERIDKAKSGGKSTRTSSRGNKATGAAGRRGQAEGAGREPWSFGESLSEIVSRTTGNVPEPIARMRALAREHGHSAFSYSDPRLFFEQAKLMEGYEDDCPYMGEFSKYYPTYEDMTTAQLRGYFTWRTRWRAGVTARASLSYLFVHVYEVLCGVGVASPEEGLAELVRLRDAYGSVPGNEALVSYLGMWIPDYVTYHGLGREALGMDAQGSPVDRAVSVLDRAEAGLLASKDPATWTGGPQLPSSEDLTFALTAASRYRLERSKVFSDHFPELEECCSAVFARMVSHCARRRKRGFMEGLFGEAEAVPYTMFRSAVFYEPSPHPDCEVKLESGVTYRCRLGRWTLLRPHRSREASAELGDILHEIDRALRLRIGGMPELKAREVPKYQQAIIDEVVDACVSRREAEEAARVRIDRSVLTGIRAASIRTREALLVDEERSEEVTAAESATDQLVAAPDEILLADLGEELAIGPEVAETAASEPAVEAGESQVAGLSADDAAILRSLLDGTYDEAALRARGVMVSLVADRINEAFFDLVGDSVIEFDGDEPHVIEDYADDVREVLA